MSAGVEAIAEAVLGKLLNEAADEALGKSLAPLLANLSRLEAKVDDQLLTHLRAGLTFLRLHEPKHALVELVRAEAADATAAVSSFWLGVTLGLLQRGDEGQQFIEKALTLNPYLAHGSICSLDTRDYALAAHRVPERATSGPALAVHHLRKSPLLRPWWKPPWLLGSGASAVRFASVAGGVPVLQCMLSRDLLTISESNSLRMVLFAMGKDNKPLWIKKTRDRLVTASDLVIIMSTPSGRWRLLDVRTGRLIREHSDEFFSTSFFPQYFDVCGTSLFKRANWSSMHPVDALETITRDVVGDTATRNELIEGTSLLSIDNSVRADITNTWIRRRVHMGRGMPADALHAEANVEIYRQHRL